MDTFSGKQRIIGNIVYFYIILLQLSNRKSNDMFSAVQK